MNRTIKKLKIMNAIFVLILLMLSLPATASVPVRIKDIVDFESIRDNFLVGYGLVVGLRGTGDDLNNSVYTANGLNDFLSKMGVNTKNSQLKTKNVAAVTVTASLPAFSRVGSRISVNISTIGDAKSIEGGILLATTLIGADGEVYAVAQGPISIDGFEAISKNGTTVSRGVTTSGSIPSGGIVEKEIDFDLDSLKSMKISLKNPDISTSTQIAQMINDRMGDAIATPLDPRSIQLNVPSYMNGDVLALLTKIETIEIVPDMPAKIIVDEASGTVVIGENVRISPVAVAQGNLTIVIQENTTVSQPGAFANVGTTQTVNNANISVDDSRGTQIRVIPKATTLQDLVDGLNSLGVAPRDLITILGTIKQAGALQATIETM